MGTRKVLIKTSNTIPTNTYVLPPRSTRGILPRRYDPEFESRRSKYPISNIVESKLSKKVFSFHTAVCSDNISRNVDEALKSKE